MTEKGKDFRKHPKGFRGSWIVLVILSCLGLALIAVSREVSVLSTLGLVLIAGAAGYFVFMSRSPLPKLIAADPVGTPQSAPLHPGHVLRVTLERRRASYAGSPPINELLIWLEMSQEARELLKEAKLYGKVIANWKAEELPMYGVKWGAIDDSHRGADVPALLEGNPSIVASTNPLVLDDVENQIKHSLQELTSVIAEMRTPHKPETIEM
ncbi:MAG: hypothetical protein ACLP7P_19365 [Rhodomicrobium sp.]